jgi:hypothetical protein
MIAAAPGWRNLAIWAMPPAAYALASDTLETASSAPRPLPATSTSPTTGHAAGHPRWPDPLAAGPGPGPGLHPGGFRAWVLAECPVVPGRRAPRPAAAASSGRRRATVPRKATKTARFLDLVTERYGVLASVPLNRVAGISADLALTSA